MSKGVPMDNSNGILLSICIPTYNRESYLLKLLNSLVYEFSLLDSKGKEEIEICISDNSSDDNTQKIVMNFSSDLPIKYNRKKSKVSGGRNLLSVFKMAYGKYVWIVGDDDIVINDSILYLQKLIKKTMCDTYHVKVLHNKHNKKSVYFNWLKDETIISNRQEYELFIKKDQLYGTGFIGSNIFNNRSVDINDVEEMSQDSFWPNQFLLMYQMSSVDCAYITKPLLIQIEDDKKLFWKPESWIIVRFDKVKMLSILLVKNIIDRDFAVYLVFRYIFSMREFKDIFVALINTNGKLDLYKEEIKKYLLNNNSEYKTLVRCKLVLIYIISSIVFRPFIKLLSFIYSDLIVRNKNKEVCSDGNSRFSA